jgi:hypothetical protein
MLLEFHVFEIIYLSFIENIINLSVCIHKFNIISPEVEPGIFTPGENVKIMLYLRPSTRIENFFLIINIQSYLVSFNLISVFNKVKNIKLVVNNYKNYTI